MCVDRARKTSIKVEFLIKMTSKKYEIRKQVLGGDPDLEKTGRTLNRVIEWDRDGITIEADVRQIMKGLELERADHSATPCDVAKRDECKGRTDADEGRPSTNGLMRTTMTTETDPGWPMTMPMTARHSQVVTFTRHGALVARISYLSQDRPDLKFASMRACCAMAKPSMRDMEYVKRIGKYLVGKPRAKCWFRWQQSGDLEAYSDADWGGDRATRRSVSAGVITRGDHYLKVWTMKQQVVGREGNRRGICESNRLF